MVVATLRKLVEQLPPGDSVARCRVMIGLANEIYYTSSAREREALCEEALAMARRLGDEDRTAGHPARRAPRRSGARAPRTSRFEVTAEAADLARGAGRPGRARPPP